jgi:hypothetical protein
MMRFLSYLFLLIYQTGDLLEKRVKECDQGAYGVLSLVLKGK